MTEFGACTHTGPQEVADMAQAYLTKAGVPVAEWDNCRFGFGENVVSDVWKSVFIEVERRGSDWVVMNIDRRKELISEADRGLVVVRLSEGANKQIKP